MDFDGLETVFSPDGEPLDNDTVTKISDFMWTTIEEAFEYSNRHKDNISSDQSLLDFFLGKVAQQEKLSEVERDLCIEYCKLWGAYIGESVARQSLKFFCLEECIDGSESSLLFLCSLTYHQ